MTKRKTRKEAQTEINKVKPIEAKTENQRDYIRTIIENDVIFCTGPSGSGKSYIAAGIAANHLFSDKIENVIVTRPLVCTGKEIGHLPGELMDKITPYLLPMQENLKHFLGRQHYGSYHNSGKIKYFPLEVMRGSTFHDTYMILDEAQNCTFEQIKMFITRMGKNSKVLINGDIRQTDLYGSSGLSEIVDSLRGIRGVGFAKLTTQDIQRNGILGRILNALEN